MKYIKEIDEKKHTIIMMQPENEDLRKIYNLIGQLTPIITDFHGQGRIDGIPLDKEIQVTILDLGQYAFTFRHSFTLGWEESSQNDTWDMAGAIIIQTGDDEFYIAGSGIVATFQNLSKTVLNVGIKVNEGRFENNTWKIIRHLNGDQTHQGRHI